MFLRYDYIIILYKFFIIARVFYRTAAIVISFEYKSLILHNVCAVHFSVFSWKNYVITKQYQLKKKTKYAFDEYDTRTSATVEQAERQKLCPVGVRASYVRV